MSTNSNNRRLSPFFGDFKDLSGQGSGIYKKKLSKNGICPMFRLAFNKKHSCAAAPGENPFERLNADAIKVSFEIFLSLATRAAANMFILQRRVAMRWTRQFSEHKELKVSLCYQLISYWQIQTHNHPQLSVAQTAFNTDEVVACPVQRSKVSVNERALCDKSIPYREVEFTASNSADIVRKHVLSAPSCSTSAPVPIAFGRIQTTRGHCNND